MKKYILMGIVLVLAGVAAYLIFAPSAPDVFGKESYEFQKYSSDVVGTHTGTTTLGVAFRITGSGGQTATSTYITRIGKNINQAIYTILPTEASSTSNIMLNIMGSNDDYCDSTATSTLDAACVGDCVLASQINWFSAGDHVKGKAGVTDTLGNASTTVQWMWTNPKPNVGNEIILENLGYECLRLGISGSSTRVYVGISTK